ncbi:MAG: hypothetical protein HQ582_21790 [Planctomycetes bacterium]|nr:hypothetical protein [Planctomycetota bacterium]
MDPSRRSEILQMLADHTKGNYEKIRTWQGTCAVRLQQSLSRAYVAKAFGGILEEQDVSALTQEFDFAMQFAVDIQSESIYRSKETSAMRFTKQGSKETVEIPGVKPADARSVVTREHYVDFSPKVRTPAFGVLPDHPEARDKRAAFRNPVEESEGHRRGDLMDPRDFFGFSSSYPFGEELIGYISAMKGESGEDLMRRANDRLTVYQAVDRDGTWCRLVMKLTAPDGASEIYSTTIWSPAAGFNPVRLVMAKDRAGEQPIRIMQWQWELSGDVYVPAWVSESTYGPEGGEPSYQRETTIEECAVNRPLEPGQFTYRGLGLAEGDLVLDRIEDVVYVMRDGEPEKLANFGEKYVAPDESAGFGPLVRWSLVAVGVVVLVLFAFFARARGAKRQKENFTG